MYYVYKILNTLSGKVYIGQSNKETERWRQHKYFARNPEKTGQYIHRAMAKYSPENFTYEVIACCTTQENTDECEAILIKQYDSRNPQFGYNIAPGGSSAWNRGLPKELNPLTGVPRSEETKKKISKGSLGKIMPPCSDKRKKHMSELYSGRSLPNDWVEKIAAANRGQVRSEKSKSKMSNSHIGIQAGEKHPGAKVNWDIVSKIRAEYSENKISQTKLAKKYKLTRAIVWSIVNHRTWKT